MSSMVRCIQRGVGNHIGLLTSARAAWGAKLGVHNDVAADLLAREARKDRRKPSRPPRALRRAKRKAPKRVPNVAQSPPQRRDDDAHKRKMQRKGYGKVRRAELRKAREAAV